MQILVTNDDGIESPSINPLYRALASQHNVTIVVPATNQSGKAQAFTYDRPLSYQSIEKDGIPCYSVVGTPCDCVKFAICHLMKDGRPDLVLSGINIGENAGMSTIYSGTVAAAREGAMWGIPSIAISIWDSNPESLEYAAQWAARFIAEPELFPTKPFHLLNVNFPNCQPEKISGLSLTTMSSVMFIDGYRESKNQHGYSDFQLEGYKPSEQFDRRSDDYALSQGRISVTPLSIDQTHADALLLHSKNEKAWHALWANSKK